MKPIILCRHDLLLHPESSRVIIRPFIPLEKSRITTIIGRALLLSEEEVLEALSMIRAEFVARHFDIDEVMLYHFQMVERHVFTQRPLSNERKFLIGAMFSGEYALESAALFNPSIVPHPDQSDIDPGALRFVMSLRATGEGHISSIEFRSGIIDAEGCVKLDEVSKCLTVPHILRDPNYNKRRFLNKLHEMGAVNEHCLAVIDPLPDQFTLTDLRVAIESVRKEAKSQSLDLTRTIERIQWLADCNYELQFPLRLKMSERIIFPVSANESNGIEDARFVRFVEDNGSFMYYATYTAYNGRSTLPQLIETHDFHHFRILTLSGNGVQNKGMAFFPRKIGGQYVTLSRHDDENLYLIRSYDPHHWDNPELLMRPSEMWESVKIGNCGSPIETEAGWLVITHGVGPMRKYCIGAALLDLNDPSKVLGRLREPLILPEGNEREGYVPNVVYSCGSLVHNKTLILPYAMSDKATAVVSIGLDELLSRLIEDGPSVRAAAATTSSAATAATP
ncbi:MAG: hypothetical protein RIR37_157 [Verrucomicrobiota bacterium]|jgi:predicted GH43/DUF377 family glycosyl hydrolase